VKRSSNRTNAQWDVEITRLKQENSRLQNELLRDDLTGLWNARCLRERLGESIRSRLIEKQEPSLLFIDVDRFKEVNEWHGHRAAGEVLGQIGALIASLVRNKDIAFRYGGDEFVVLVCGGDSGARQVGERIRAAIEAHEFVVEGLNGLATVRVTVSLRLRVIMDGDSTQSILEAADRAMFEAKRNSRNTLMAA
jgi:diguanylate cyclase (GGDEF)-like protein